MFLFYYQVYSFIKETTTRKCECGNSIAFAIERICDILNLEYTSRDINQEIKALSVGCTGKIMEFGKTKFRGAHLSLDKLNPTIKERLLGKDFMLLQISTKMSQSNHSLDMKLKITLLVLISAHQAIVGTDFVIEKIIKEIWQNLVSVRLVPHTVVMVYYGLRVISPYNFYGTKKRYRIQNGYHELKIIGVNA